MTGAGGGQSQLSRLLALLPYLRSHPGVRLSDVAREFGVTQERLSAELDLLWVCGLPGHGPGDLIDFAFEADTVTLTEPAGVERPLRLTVDEAVALVVALRALAETPGLSAHDAVDRALAKIEQAAGDAALPAGRVAVRVESEERVQPVVEQALRDRRRLHLSYLVPSRDEVTERDVDPVRLLFVDGRAYLEAWCRRAEGRRTFRLDRVVGIDLLDEPADPPGDLQLVDIERGLFAPSSDALLVTLALRREAAWVAEYYPCEQVEPRPDGDLVVSLRVGDAEWARRLALRLGSSARVLGPPEVADQVRTQATLALAAYAQDSLSPQ